MVLAADQQPQSTSQKIELGMHFDETIKILKDKKMKHLEVIQKTATSRAVSFRWDSNALTVLDKLIDSKGVLTFDGDNLVKIEMYSRKGTLIDSDLKHLYIH